jgi:hypothetical protein
VKPSPAPKTSRPFDSLSTEVACRASVPGRRLATGVTSGPSLIRSVSIAITVSSTHGSAVSGAP